VRLEVEEGVLTRMKQMPRKATTPKAKGSEPGGGCGRPRGCCWCWEWTRGIEGDGDGGGGERCDCGESTTSDIARSEGGEEPMEWGYGCGGIW
jgi:hypothetical protein